MPDARPDLTPTLLGASRGLVLEFDSFDIMGKFNSTAQDETEVTGCGQPQPIGCQLTFSKGTLKRGVGLGLASRADVEGRVANERGEQRNLRAENLRGKNWKTRAEQGYL